MSIYQVLSKHEQREAYLDGWKVGHLDKKHVNMLVDTFLIAPAISL